MTSLLPPPPVETPGGGGGETLCYLTLLSFSSLVHSKRWIHAKKERKKEKPNKLSKFTCRQHFTVWFIRSFTKHSVTRVVCLPSILADAGECRLYESKLEGKKCINQYDNTIPTQSPAWVVLGDELFRYKSPAWPCIHLYQYLISYGDLLLLVYVYVCTFIALIPSRPSSLHPINHYQGREKSGVKYICINLLKTS